VQLSVFVIDPDLCQHLPDSLALFDGLEQQRCTCGAFERL